VSLLRGALVRDLTKTTHVRPSDLRAFGRLAADATSALTDLWSPCIGLLAILRASSTPDPTRLIASLVYSSIRAVTRLVGGGMDSVLAQLIPMPGGRISSPEREAVLAALNGVLGDYLARSGNPLAIPICLRRGGQVLILSLRLWPDGIDKGRTACSRQPRSARLPRLAPAVATAHPAAESASRSPGTAGSA
jgi:hypothetical protein